jgi:hypothetical protein
VAGAASTVLVHFFPDEASRIDALADQLADPAGDGFARGRVAGRLLVARAQTDWSDEVWTGTAPTGRGYWVPTPPAYIYPPLERLPGRGDPGTCVKARNSVLAHRPSTGALSFSRSSARWTPCRGA